jgi:hypothetical protein
MSLQQGEEEEVRRRGCGMEEEEEDKLESTLQVLLIYIGGMASYRTTYETVDGFCVQYHSGWLDVVTIYKIGNGICELIL